MAITDILLRTVTHADLSTKNAVITWEEEDQNFIEIYEALKSLLSVDVTLFEPYNAGTTYSSGDYVSYNNNIYRFINVTPTAGITPGSDILYWELASVGEFAHQQNHDQYLDFGGPNQVSAEDLYDLIHGGGTFGFFTQGGNSFGATATLGTNDAYDLVLETSGTEYLRIKSDGKVQINQASALATHWAQKSQGNDSTTYSQKWLDSSDAILAYLRDDGAFRVNDSINVNDDPTTLSGQQVLLNVLGSGSGVPFLHGFFSNEHAEGRAQFTVSSESYPDNLACLSTHGSAFASNNYMTNVDSTNAGYAILFAQGTSLNGLGVGTYSDTPLYLFSNNVASVQLHNRNFGIGTMDGTLPSGGWNYGGGVGVMFIGNAATEATTAATDGALLWAISNRLKTNTDIEMDGLSGLIMKDRTTATKYRLYIDSGSLALETV